MHCTHSILSSDPCCTFSIIICIMFGDCGDSEPYYKFGAVNIG